MYYIMRINIPEGIFDVYLLYFVIVRLFLSIALVAHNYLYIFEASVDKAHRDGLSSGSTY